MKTLVDTSVWIDHLRKGDRDLIHLLETGQVLVHSAVIGELACGSLKERERRLANLKLLPHIKEADPEDTLQFIEFHSLWGKGLGWIDVQLLASAVFSDADLLTRDRTLHAAFQRIR